MSISVEVYNTVEVLLFGAGLPTAGLPARCQVFNDSLQLDYQLLNITFDKLTAEVGGFNHNQLQLHWRVNDDGYMLIPSNAAGQKALRTILQ